MCIIYGNEKQTKKIVGLALALVTMEKKNRAELVLNQVEQVKE